MKHLDSLSSASTHSLRRMFPWLELSDEQLTSIIAFSTSAQQYAEAAGLTSSDLEETFFLSQVAPAITGWRLVRPAAGWRIADLGAGAGSFAVTAAILCPATYVLAVDSSRRHAEFIQNEAKALQLGNLEVIAERIESAASRSPYAAGFDLVGCRALAAGSKPFELSRPLIRPGGSLFLWRTTAGVVEHQPPFLHISQLDLSSYAPRLTVARYDIRTPERLWPGNAAFPSARDDVPGE